MESSQDGDNKWTALTARRRRSPTRIERDLFDLLVNRGRAQGIDLLDGFRPTEFFRALPEEAQSCLRQLCDLGCDSIAISFLSFFARFGARLDEVIAVAFGPSEERALASRRLDEAARTYDTRTGFGASGQLVRRLRRDSQMVALPSVIADAFGARSAAQFSRYALAKYVQRVTRRPHDRLVSGLLTGIFDDSVGLYCVENQRMWRTRQHARRPRLDEAASQFVNLVIALTALFEVEYELPT